MVRLGHIFSSRDREFFDLFEEAAQNVVRGAASSTSCSPTSRTAATSRGTS